MKKYIVLPSEVRSKTDKDVHYIGCNQLVELYGVNPKECIFVHPSKKPIYSRKFCDENNLDFNNEKDNPTYMSIDERDIRVKVLGMTRHSISNLIVLKPRSDGFYKLESPLFLSNYLVEYQK